MSTRRHRKPAPELDLDVLQNGSNMKGLLSFLERTPEQSRIQMEQRDRLEAVRAMLQPPTEGLQPSRVLSFPAAQEQESIRHQEIPSVDPTSMDASSRDVGSVVVTSVDNLAAVKASRDGGLLAVQKDRIQLIARGMPPRELGSTWISLTSGKAFHASKVQWVAIAQQSMTPNQERFYETIWRAKSDYYFEVHTINRHTKRFCAGYDVLSRICRIASRNVRIIIPLLIQKQILFSYRDYESKLRRGTTYEIFSYEETLRRQRAVGLCYVAKSGPGLDFVAPENCLRSMDASSLDARALDEQSLGDSRPDESTMNVMEGSVDPTSREPLDATSRISLDVTSSLLVKDTLDRQSSATMRSLLQAQLPTFDDAAITRLWADCRRQVPDLKVEEIAILFAAKLPGSRARGIENPNGFLLRAVTTSCTPAAIRALREQGREEQPDVPVQLKKEDLEQLLTDSNTPEEMRARIRARLADVI